MKSRRWVWTRAGRSKILLELMRLADGVILEAHVPLRTNEQNKMIYAILREFSRQKTWIVNGSERYLSPEEWKDILTVGFNKEIAQIAPSLDGQALILVGKSTSSMTRKEASDFVDYLLATAHDMGVDLATQ